jgi:hypothetical protein
MSETPLDPRRLEQLMTYADGGIVPIDPVAVANAAMTAPRRWLPFRGVRPLALALLGIMLAVTLALGLVGTSREPVPPPPLLTPLAAPAVSWGHAATRLHDGRVVLVGSLQGPNSPTYQPAAWVWDPATNAFDRTGDPEVAREGAIATTLPDGPVLVAGGTTWVADVSGGATGYPQASAELYDPRTGTFTRLPQMTTTRGLCRCMGRYERPLATLLQDGRVLIAGSAPREATDGSGEAPLALELYDPEDQTFHSITGAPRCQSGQVLAVALADGRVLIRCLDGAWLYDPIDGSFEQTGELPDGARPNIGAVSIGAGHILGDGRVLLTGALSMEGRRARTDGLATLYDPASESFTVLLDQPNPPAWPASVSVGLADGRVLFVEADGWSDGDVSGGSARLFDPLTSSFGSVLGRLEGIQSLVSATRLGDGRVLILGTSEEEAHAVLFDPAALSDAA